MSATIGTPGLGINPGHGFVKIVVLADGYARQIIVIPSIVAPADKQLVGALRKIEAVDVAGGSWWVGEDAMLSNHVRTVLKQDRMFDSSFIPALVKGALSRVRAMAYLPRSLLLQRRLSRVFRPPGQRIVSYVAP